MNQMSNDVGTEFSGLKDHVQEMTLEIAKSISVVNDVKELKKEKGKMRKGFSHKPTCLCRFHGC